jgi:kinesin family member 11
LKTEAENEGLLSDFQSELDHSLGVLQSTVFGSVCEQRKLLESMNELSNSYFSAKTEVLP